MHCICTSRSAVDFHFSAFHYSSKVTIFNLENGFRCTYNISVSVWSHEVLKLLFLSAGLTWGDEATQQVLSQELSKLRRIPYRPQQKGPVYDSNTRSHV